MIDRYCRPEMKEVWSEARRLSLWLDVERDGKARTIVLTLEEAPGR